MAIKKTRRRTAPKESVKIIPSEVRHTGLFRRQRFTVDVRTPFATLSAKDQDKELKRAWDAGEIKWVPGDGVVITGSLDALTSLSAAASDQLFPSATAMEWLDHYAARAEHWLTEHEAPSTDRKTARGTRERQCAGDAVRMLSLVREAKEALKLGDTERLGRLWPQIAHHYIVFTFTPVETDVRAGRGVRKGGRVGGERTRTDAKIVDKWIKYAKQARKQDPSRSRSKIAADAARVIGGGSSHTVQRYLKKVLD